MSRGLPTTELELREAGDGTLRLTGYASVTETPYDVGFYTECIKRGAFKRTLAEQPDVVLLVNHEGLPLARTKPNATLRLAEHDRGLYVDADLDPRDPDVRALVPKMRRGDVDQMSFAFRVTDQEWNDDRTYRTIRQVSLHRGDVSVVTNGANEAAAASIRALGERKALQRDLPLEERRRRADEIGDRVTGGATSIPAGLRAACSRCAGAGCPTCSGGHEPRRAPLPDLLTSRRMRLDLYLAEERRRGERLP